MEYIFPKISIVFYSGIGTIVLGVLLFLGIIWGKKGPLNYIFGSIVCIIVGIFILHVAKGGTLKIEDQTVKMKIPMFSQKSFSFDELVQTEVVDFNMDSQYLPVKKKSGTAIRDFKSGWFELKKGEKAFFLLEGRKAIYLKTKDGNAYVIGIKNFNQLIEKFQQNLEEISIHNNN
jgi:hypothetical protein